MITPGTFSITDIPDLANSAGTKPLKRAGLGLKTAIV